MLRRNVSSDLIVLAVLELTLAAPGRVLAQQEQAVLSGVQYLRGHTTNQRVGETAMIALTLLKADTPKTDPVLSTCLATVRARLTK
jgi:hypothetical protein